MNQATKVCLNCGHECTGAYCPNCGQPTEVGETITRQTFLKSISRSLARMTPGFWATFIGLIIHPWVVIREYIYGKRVKYSEPVTMAIQQLVYFTFLYTILGIILDIDFFVSQLGLASSDMLSKNKLIHEIFASKLVQRLILALIVAINCYIVYRHKSRKKHNIYEYIVAAIYMGCSVSIYFNLLRPIGILYPQYEYWIGCIIALIIVTVSIFKAFPIRPWWKAWFRWCLFMSLNIITTFCFSFILLDNNL